jgi:hypothetical protein
MEAEEIEGVDAAGAGATIAMVEVEVKGVGVFRFCMMLSVLYMIHIQGWLGCYLLLSLQATLYHRMSLFVKGIIFSCKFFGYINLIAEFACYIAAHGCNEGGGAIALYNTFLVHKDFESVRSLPVATQEQFFPLNDRSRPRP